MQYSLGINVYIVNSVIQYNTCRCCQRCVTVSEIKLPGYGSDRTKEKSQASLVGGDSHRVTFGVPRYSRYSGLTGEDVKNYDPGLK